MPETLNNKTGLVKRKCTDLAAFDPFTEAVALPEEDEPISVKVDMCPEITLKGHHFGPIKSLTAARVPLFLAVYLISRGAAKVDSPKAPPSPLEPNRQVSAA
jgi:DNA primase small subunit